MTISVNVAGSPRTVGGVFVKVAGEWKSVCDGDNIAEGAPPAPIIDTPDGGSVIQFTSGGEGTAGHTLAFGAHITPAGPDLLVEWDEFLSGGEVQVTNATPDTDYVVEVYAVNVEGRGESSFTNSFQLNFNVATGGTETIEDNYNGTNEKWKVHTFTSPGTFTVTKGTQPFRVMSAGHGGNGGYSWHYGWTGGWGGRGETVDTMELELRVGDLDVVLGTASVDGLNIARQGGTATGAGDGHHGANGSPSFPCIASDITGVEVACYGGAGGAPGDPNGGGGKPGGAGRVIIAYQIGTSTTREIQQAQAEAAAREAGYATGYDAGVTDGYDAARDDLQAAVEAAKEAEENPVTMDDE